MPPEEKPTASPIPSVPQNLATPIAIVAAGALIAVAVYFSPHTGTVADTGGTQQQGQLVTTAAQMKALIKSNTNALYDPAGAGGTDRFIGKKDAPLTLTYWFDYQCPFCKMFEQQTLPALIQKYVNTGKLKIVFKDFPFLGVDSGIDAEYADAIWELYPDKFFAWHSAMFDVQDAEGDAGFGNAATVDTLDSLIPGIDANKVKALVAQKKTAYDAAIGAEQKDGQTNGVNGTPGFTLGKQQIEGAQPLATFTQAIDAALAGK